jgi:putative ABC transport system permease protein
VSHPPRLSFVLAMTAREGRSSLRRLGALIAAVAAGVAALVAINTFTDALQASVRAQARALLGGDLVASSAYPFTAETEKRLRRLADDAGGPVARARVVRFTAMAYVPRTAGTRLVQVQAVEPGYPYYGEVRTEPAGAWDRLAEGGVLVDPALLTALDARVGDELALGEARFPIRGMVTDVPGDVALRSALGPRVFVSFAGASRTGLLAFGSRARHEVYLKLPARAEPTRLADRHRAGLAALRVNLRSASDDERSLGEGLGRLGRYLGLVALTAVLLGGVGVASAVHVLIKRRLETVAVLRCLGATGGEVLIVYLLQAGAIGLLGGLLGAAAGVGLQLLLPRVLGEFLPVDVGFAVSGRAVAFGLVVGLWVALAFALLPLLEVRRVSPLAALRRPYEEAVAARRWDRARLLAMASLAAVVILLAIGQAPTVVSGLVFAAGIGVVLAACALAARVLAAAVRRFGPRQGPYVWRQGLANLHRPANQTATVVLALGFGLFLLETVFLVQGNLLRDLRVDTGRERPNLVLFDIQPDQRQGVEQTVRASGHRAREAVPIVPMRIASLKGQPASGMLATAAGKRDERRGGAAVWALRREYRSTYRDTAVPTETTVAGEWWPAGTWQGRAGAGTPALPVPVSVEDDVARELGVGLGDAIAWDVQGLVVHTRVAHLRHVDWGRFETNFFVVFPEGPLAEAPRSYVTLARVEDPATRARLSRRIAEAFPNVTALDVTQVQQAVERVVGRMALAIRFMAVFTLVAGAVVLLGAVAGSRRQRLREGVLLRTMGATRAQVLRILLAEYACLGVMSAVAAAGLAAVASWALLRFLFESPFALSAPGMLSLSAGAVVMTVSAGLLGSRDLLGRPPLEALRAE